MGLRNSLSVGGALNSSKQKHKRKFSQSARKSGRSKNIKMSNSMALIGQQTPRIKNTMSLDPWAEDQGE